MTATRLRRAFWIGAAGILCLAALIALVAVLGGTFSETDGRILVTLMALLYAGGTAVSGLALDDRGDARAAVGRAVAIASPLGLGSMLWGVWSFVFEGESQAAGKVAWSAFVALAACLITSTGFLLARRPGFVTLAAAASTLAATAAAVSIGGIWAEPAGDGYVKLVAALWILAVLGYFLVPVGQRFTGAGATAAEVRVLAVLGDVELVASRHLLDGTSVAERLRGGERLTLRRRAA